MVRLALSEDALFVGRGEMEEVWSKIILKCDCGGGGLAKWKIVAWVVWNCETDTENLIQHFYWPQLMRMLLMWKCHSSLARLILILDIISLPPSHPLILSRGCGARLSCLSLARFQTWTRPLKYREGNLGSRAPPPSLSRKWRPVQPVLQKVRLLMEGLVVQPIR